MPRFTDITCKAGRLLTLALVLPLVLTCAGCTVVSIAGTAVSVTSTVVGVGISAGSAVIGATASVAKGVIGSGNNSAD